MKFRFRRLFQKHFPRPPKNLRRRNGKTETRPIGKTEHGKQALLELEFGKTNITPVFHGTRLAPVGLLPEQGKEFEALAGKIPLYDVRAR